MTRTVKGFSPRTRSLLVVLPFLFVILLLDVSSMYNMSRTIDERRHVKFGKNIIERTLSGPSSQRMPITMLNYLPSRVTASLHLDLTKKTEDFLSRLPSVLTSLLLALFVFRWSDRLYGTRGATLSLALYTFCPTILAHSRVATTDIYCACFMLISLYCFTAYLKRPGPATLIVAAIVTGIAQVTKSTALLLFPLYVILWLINLLYVKDRLGPARLAPSRASIARGTVRAVVFLCIVALMINVAYLFQGSCAPLGESIERFRVESVESSEAKSDQVFNKIISLSSHFSGVPVPLPAAYVKVFFLGTYFNATGRGHCPVYLLGKLSQRGWWYYFPIALALKTPLALFALLVIAAFLARTYIKKNPLDELGLMAATILILVFFTFFCTAQIGVRYLLPIFPLLYVFAGKVASHRPHRWAGRYRAGILGLVLWFVVSSVSFHPHYIPYFNELIGDRKNMYRYLADSNVDWGQTAYYLQDYLERHRGENISVVPATPISGKVIVSVNSLVGVSTSPERYEWLRDKFAPVDHIGYGLLIYDIPEAELPVQPTE